MRRLDLFFTALLLPLDFLALLAAAITAYALRYSQFFTEVRPVLQEIPITTYLITSGWVILTWIALFAIAGLYSIRPRRAWHELGRIILSCTSGMMLVIAIVFFRREVTTSRFLVLAVWALAISYIWIGRLLLRFLRRRLLRAGMGHQHIALIGQGRAATDLIQVYKTTPVLGYTVAKHLKQWDERAEEQLETFLKRGSLEGILIADPDISKQHAREIAQFAETHHLVFRYLADVFAANFARVDISTAEGIPIIEAKRTPLDGWGRILKRTFDIVFSLLAIIITSPILLIALISIAIEDGFPVVFHNPRIGERARPFRLYKIRSMWRKYCVGPQFQDAEKKNLALEASIIRDKGIKASPVYKIGDDPRITPVGKWLRRWSIDEIPQFWNVLIGDMSIVGPRPHQPREVEKYDASDRTVLAIKPGITGMGQISGRRDLDFADEIRLDQWYIEHWSPGLDLYILLKTPVAVLSKKGVY